MSMFKSSFIRGFLPFFILFLLLFGEIYSNNHPFPLQSCALSGHDTTRYRIMFYNVENLFDTVQASSEDERTPEGRYRWTKSRYYRKLNALAKVIVSSGITNVPDIVAVSEVENENVVKDLCQKTPLSIVNMKYVHIEDDDPRGIENAVLYNPKSFSVVKASLLSLSNDPEVRISRDVLILEMLSSCNDRLFLLVNHWPSRYSGHVKTEVKRRMAALNLRRICDSIYNCHPEDGLVVVGDFNDDYNSEVMHILTQPNEKGDRSSLNNLMETEKPDYHGTIKSKGEWSYFDQVFVSDNMIRGDTLSLASPQVKIIHHSFLLEKEKRHIGDKPFRTYLGPAYHGGFSDHLPISIDLIRLP